MVNKINHANIIIPEMNKKNCYINLTKEYISFTSQENKLYRYSKYEIQVSGIMQCIHRDCLNKATST